MRQWVPTSNPKLPTLVHSKLSVRSNLLHDTEDLIDCNGFQLPNLQPSTKTYQRGRTILCLKEKVVPDSWNPNLDVIYATSSLTFQNLLPAKQTKVAAEKSTNRNNNKLTKTIPFRFSSIFKYAIRS